MATTFAERIRELRSENHLSAYEFAEFIGMSVNSVWAWERGETVPRRETLFKIADTFDVRYNWLNLGEGPKKSSTIKTPIINNETGEVVVEELPRERPKTICYTERDKENLDNIMLAIRALPSTNLTLEEKKKVFLTLSEFRSKLETKMLFAE